MGKWWGMVEEEVRREEVVLGKKMMDSGREEKIRNNGK